MKKWGFINAWIRDAHDAELDNNFASLLSFNLACVQRGIQKLPTRRFFFFSLRMECRHARGAIASDWK